MPRLRLLRLVPQNAASYGSDNYGDNTYGQRATDAADLQRYEVVPLNTSPSDRPLGVVRVGDTTPFRFRVMAFQSEYETAERSGTVLDLSGVSTAVLRLLQSSIVQPDHDYIPPLPDAITVPLTIDAANDILSASFSDRTELRTNRTYRAIVALSFATGRLLTIPPDDSLQVVLVDSYQ